MLARSLPLVVALFAAASAIDVFVSTQGTDSPSGGSQTRPYSGEAINVLIEGGVYELTSPLSFTPADSGSAGAPVTYASQPGTGPVTISGGMEVDPTSWVQSKSNPSLWSCKLPADTVYFRQLWVNGDRYVMARSPVMEYVSANATTITYSPGQLPTTNPHNLNDTEVVTYESWTASVHLISAIDAATNTIHMKNDLYTKFLGGSGKRYYIENFLEALDQPGEFYYDRGTNLLSIIVLGGIKPSESVAMIPQLMELVTASGSPTQGQLVTDIVWANVTFSNTQVEVAPCYSSACNGQSAAFLTTAAVHLLGANRWLFDGVTVSNIGGYAFWVDEACANNTLDGVHVIDTGAGGVRIGAGRGGVEPDPRLLNVGTTVTNSILENGGKFYQEGAGVLAQQVVAVNISHNIIRNFSYTGVSMGWTWGYNATSVSDNYVAFNEIYNIGLSLLSDMGCIYSLGAQPGSLIITNNVCHDVMAFNYGGGGLYTDEGSRDLTYTNNIVYNTMCAGIHQHYGLDNVFKNNVIAYTNLKSCDGAIRSTQHNGNCTFPAEGSMGACSSFTLDTNIIYAVDDEVFFTPGVFGFDNMTFINNDYWSIGVGADFRFPRNRTFSEWQAVGKDIHSVVADPQFVAPQSRDFTKLQPSSPALGLGFVPIDTASVGPLRAVGAEAMAPPTVALPDELLGFTKAGTQ